MTSDPEPAPVPARVRLALPDGPLRDRLQAALETSGVAVEAGTAGVGDDDKDVDVVVVARQHLDGARGAGAPRVDLAGGAGVVVLDEDGAEQTRSDLMASGASLVLDATDAPTDLASSIRTVAEAEQDGGLTGPAGRDPDSAPRLADFLSRSPYMQSFLDTVRRLTDADSTLLVTGETGVGKERLARAIHAESPRAAGPFVSVNCGALPEALLESELFGHVKGAFTGADQDRVGVFEAADGGTLFLDEVGEMPLVLQVRLLTALQRREVTPLGTHEPRRVDVRVIAATNRDVRAQVREGTFREDLYYRLAVVPLEIPALRERPEDVPDLVGRLVHFFRDRLPTSRVERVAPDALEAMVAHDWPGNVRELVNAVERGMLLSEGEELARAALPPEVVAGAGSAARAKPAAPDTGATLKQVREAAVAAAEEAYLRALLAEEEGSIQRTASRAGISPRALYDRLKRYAIDKAEFKPPR